MTKKQFWRLISKFQAASSGDTDAFYALAEEEMAQFSAQEVKSFRTYVAAYMTLAYESAGLTMACKIINGSADDEMASAFILWLIAQGEKTYLNALRRPDSLAKLTCIPFGEAEFELLISVGVDFEDDYEIAENRLEVYLEELRDTIAYKNNEIHDAYIDFNYNHDEIAKFLPKLVKKAALNDFDWKH